MRASLARFSGNCRGKRASGARISEVSMSANPHTESRFHPRQTTETRAGRAPFRASCPTSNKLRRYLRKEDAGTRAYGAQISSTPIPTKAHGGGGAFAGELSGEDARWPRAFPWQLAYLIQPAAHRNAPTMNTGKQCISITDEC